MGTPTYDPKLVVLTFLGSVITGFADGTFVKASRTEETFKPVVGADGKVTRVRSANKTGKVSFMLMQSSFSNDILTAAQAADELANLGIGPLLVKDLGGTSLIAATSAWITKPADLEFGKELGTRTWEFDAEEIYIVGGTILGI